MNVLEKILEEVEEATFQEDAPIYLGDMEVDRYVRESVVKEIIRHNMNHNGDDTEMDGWIPVEERLPKRFTVVLASFDNGDVETLWQCWGEDEEALKYFELGDEERDGGIKKVIAWQPLPEPYKPKKK